MDEVNFSAVNTIQEDHKIMLTAFCVDYVVVSKLKLTVQKYQSINENRVFRLVCKNLILNLILPTTTFFSMGTLVKKNRHFQYGIFKNFG